MNGPGDESIADWPVAVIGSRGFIGTRLTAYFKEASFQVAAFTRETPFLDSNGRLAGALVNAKIILYLCSNINPLLAEEYPELVHADHELFLRFLDAVERVDQPPLVVLSSSGGGVYDPAAPMPYREDSPTAPKMAYGKAKLRLERELLDRSGRVPSVILRLSNVYGPGQRTGVGQGVIAHWLEAAAAGQPMRLYGDPSALRDYIYVDDVIVAMRKVTDRTRAGLALPGLLNIGSGQPTSLDELLTHVASVVPGSHTIEKFAGRRFDQRDVALDVSLAVRALDWRCETPLLAGLALTWQNTHRAG